MSKPIRPIRIAGDVAYVTLTKGYEAVIDAADAHLVEGLNWHVHCIAGLTYAIRNVTLPDGRRTTEKMHKRITGYAVTDHRDGDGLNNRRSNMREATQAQNMRNRRKNANNTSGFKGVSRARDGIKWQARIGIGGREEYLGQFASPEAAHAAYVAASQSLHGDFGRVA